MLERKIVKTLLEWKNSPDKKALLVKGARQVGKTWVIRQFAKRHYDYFVEINFERNPGFKAAFDGDLDTRSVVTKLTAMGAGKFVPGRTLVFFDEIQVCPNARTAIKFLVEDGSYDFIESGSLLGVNYRDVSSYPVGAERQIDMFPLDFEEFLWARGVGEDAIAYLRDCMANMRPVDPVIHEQMLKYYAEYVVVGGMPAVVDMFVKTGDIGRVHIAQKTIADNYRDDIAKYAGGDKLKVKAVFDSIPEQLSANNRRFMLSAIESGASMRKYGDATMWLSDAGVAYYCFNLKSLALPFAFNEKRNLFKLYMADTGILCCLAMKNKAFELLSGEWGINGGALAENAVAAMLVKKGHPLYYYDEKGRCELDFVVNGEDGICVIEVKSGNDYRKHTSLDKVNEKNNGAVKSFVVLCKGNVQRDGNIVYLPIYLAGLDRAKRV